MRRRTASHSTWTTEYDSTICVRAYVLLRSPVVVFLPLLTLTSRFARLNDFLLQRVFRTLDQIELADEAALDRLQRAEARGLISSAERWRELRLLRNAIAHDYLIESADRVLRESLTAAPELIETAECIGRYVHAKGYSGESSYRPLTP